MKGASMEESWRRRVAMGRRAGRSSGGDSGGPRGSGLKGMRRNWCVSRGPLKERSAEGRLRAGGGEAAQALGAAAVEAGMPENRVIHCEVSEAAATRLTAMLQADDVVLVKGSRGVRTDLVVARLEAECS